MSMEPYTDSQLRQQEMKGYLSAGVACWRRDVDGEVEVLMCDELRKRKICKKFGFGKCKFGGRCKFLHLEPGSVCECSFFFRAHFF